MPIGRPTISPSNAFMGSRAGTALAMYDLSSRVYESAKQFRSRHFAYTVSVSEDDPLYSEVHAWLMSIMPTEKHRSLLVSSADRSWDDDLVSLDDDESERRPRPALSVKFDDSANRKVVVDGFNITVWLSNPDQVGSSSNQSYGREPKKIKLQAYSYEGQQAVIKELNRINDRHAKVRKPSLKMVSSWGGWQTRSDLPARTLESVFMPAVQKDRIIADVQSFLDSEDRYNKLSIPWHRGYMFHGPPGTGKTSIVKAVGNHFGLDIWYVGLADLSSEANLLDLLSKVGPRSILLLEDIDTVKISQEQDQEDTKAKITSGSLLNALDGVSTPHGLITMMTTNRFETLNKALIRAGRMDCIEKLDWPTMSTLDDMFVHFYGRRPVEWGNYSDHILEGFSVSAAAEIFKSNMYNPEQAAEATFQRAMTV